MQTADIVIKQLALDLSNKFKLDKNLVLEFLTQEQQSLPKNTLQVRLDPKTKKFLIKGTMLVWNPIENKVIGKITGGNKVLQLQPPDIKNCIENKWEYTHKRFETEN